MEFAAVGADIVRGSSPGRFPNSRSAGYNIACTQAFRAQSRYQGYRPCRSAASQQLQQAAPLLRSWRRVVALLNTSAVWAVPQ